jgi:hypothetical protein
MRAKHPAPIDFQPIVAATEQGAVYAEGQEV